MKKVLVTYKSKTGFTERYARWIAEETGADILPLSDVNQAVLDAYQIVVFGGPLFASHILGLGKVQNWMEKFPKKVWVVFATGATPASKEFEQTIDRINFPPESIKPARFFYLLGGMNFEKMGWFNRMLIKLFGRISQKKEHGKNTTSPDQFHSFDLSHRSYTEALVKYILHKR